MSVTFIAAHHNLNIGQTNIHLSANVSVSFVCIHFNSFCAVEEMDMKL